MLGEPCLRLRVEEQMAAVALLERVGAVVVPEAGPLLAGEVDLDREQREHVVGGGRRRGGCRGWEDGGRRRRCVRLIGTEPVLLAGGDVRVVDH